MGPIKILTKSPTTALVTSPTKRPVNSPTKRPVNRPTRRPNASPVSQPPTQECPGKQKILSVVTKGDRKAFKVSYKLKRRNPNGGFETILERKKLKKSKKATDTVCVDLSIHCYRFIIKDQQGDGICCEKGKGFWKLMIKGKKKSIIYSKFKDGKKEEKKFGKCKEKTNQIFNEYNKIYT